MLSSFLLLYSSAYISLISLRVISSSYLFGVAAFLTKLTPFSRVTKMRRIVSLNSMCVWYERQNDWRRSAAMFL